MYLGAGPGTNHLTLSGCFSEQSCCGVEDHTQLGEEGFRQGLVFFQIRQDSGIAGGHIEINRRRDLGEIANGLLDQGRHRLAGVDIERAGMFQREMEVVIATERMAPGQPVDQDHLLLVEERPDLRQ